jgi:hypothetical protein
MEVVAGLLKCKVYDKSREVVVDSAYLPYDNLSFAIQRVGESHKSMQGKEAGPGSRVCC